MHKLKLFSSFQAKPKTDDDWDNWFTDQVRYDLHFWILKRQSSLGGWGIQYAFGKRPFGYQKRPVNRLVVVP